MFLPFLVIDRPNLLLPALEINKHKQIGIMTHACTSKNFVMAIKDLDLVKICDSGAFLKSSNQRKYSYTELFDHYKKIGANYGIILDFLGDSQKTIESAAKAIKVFKTKSRSFKLIGVAQGKEGNDYIKCTQALIKLGYSHIAIGGMLKKHPDSARYVTVKEESFLIDVIKAIREIWDGWLFCLGCYHPSRVELFEQYNIFGADSKRWAFRCETRLTTEQRHQQLINNFLEEDKNLRLAKYHKYLKTQEEQAIEKIKQKSDRDLSVIAIALVSCNNCSHDRRNYYECLKNQGLTYQQIAILEGISRQMVFKVLHPLSS